MQGCSCHTARHQSAHSAVHVVGCYRRFSHVARLLHGGHPLLGFLIAPGGWWWWRRRWWWLFFALLCGLNNVEKPACDMLHTGSLTVRLLPDQAAYIFSESPTAAILGPSKSMGRWKVHQRPHLYIFCQYVYLLDRGIVCLVSPRFISQSFSRITAKGHAQIRVSC